MFIENNIVRHNILKFYQNTDMSIHKKTSITFSWFIFNCDSWVKIFFIYWIFLPYYLYSLKSVLKSLSFIEKINHYKTTPIIVLATLSTHSIVINLLWKCYLNINVYIIYSYNKVNVWNYNNYFLELYLLLDYVIISLSNRWFDNNDIISMHNIDT